MTSAALVSRSLAGPCISAGLNRLTGTSQNGARWTQGQILALLALLRHVEAAASGLGGRLALDLDVFTERAIELGFHARGRVASNGSARMLQTSDGWVVVNLARPEDVELVPAWIGGEVDGDPWDSLARHARHRRSEDFVAFGRLLSLPTSVVRPPGGVCPSLPRPKGHPVTPASGARKLVVLDLSALWAGPLCGHLFTALGARVIKVESLHRRDNMRIGAPRLFARLHANQETVTLDFTRAEGCRALEELIKQADVVIEASRPRALRQLGVDAEAWLATGPGRTWISITAYGREGEEADWIGFGDDVAASAGLVAFDHHGAPVFLGDAIADPIAGLTAAWLGMTAVATGGGMVAVSMQAAAGAIADAHPNVPLGPEGQG